jgi:hypothetical protein
LGLPRWCGTTKENQVVQETDDKCTSANCLITKREHAFLDEIAHTMKGVHDRLCTFIDKQVPDQVERQLLTVSADKISQAFNSLVTTFAHISEIRETAAKNGGVRMIEHEAIKDELRNLEYIRANGRCELHALLDSQPGEGLQKILRAAVLVPVLDLHVKAEQLTQNDDNTFSITAGGVARIEEIKAKVADDERKMNVARFDDRYTELCDALDSDDRLGFDHRHEAIQALLTHDDFAERWECSPRLVNAFMAFKVSRAARLETEKVSL